MAVYKVPQDVEAEDKLIGPFGFRQFIYLIIVAFCGFLAFLLMRLSPVLVIIPLPIMAFFFIIALPLRKDQPTEVYLAAILQFHLKPKVRMWQPDGIASTVQITAPVTIEESRTKDLSEDEALNRLSSLAQIMDTRGWASRGVYNPEVDSRATTQLSDQVIADGATPDILDDSGISAQSFDQLIDQQKSQQKQAVLQKMATIQSQAPPEATTVPPIAQQVQAPPQSQTTQAPDTTLQANTPAPAQESDEDRNLIKSKAYNPYPAIHQQVIQPISAQTSTPAQTNISQGQTIPQTTSDSTPDPDIIELVNSPFSVATIAGEIHRKEESKANEIEIKLH